jgi:hypothetical protein
VVRQELRDGGLVAREQVLERGERVRGDLKVGDLDLVEKVQQDVGVEDAAGGGVGRGAARGEEGLGEGGRAQSMGEEVGGLVREGTAVGTPLECGPG